jgi:hypothetical protein
VALDWPQKDVHRTDLGVKISKLLRQQGYDKSRAARDPEATTRRFFRLQVTRTSSPQEVRHRESNTSHRFTWSLCLPLFYVSYSDAFILFCCICCICSWTPIAIQESPAFGKTKRGGRYESEAQLGLRPHPHIQQEIRTAFQIDATAIVSLATLLF